MRVFVSMFDLRYRMVFVSIRLNNIFSNRIYEDMSLLLDRSPQNSHSLRVCNIKLKGDFTIGSYQIQQQSNLDPSSNGPANYFAYRMSIFFSIDEHEAIFGAFHDLVHSVAETLLIYPP